MNICGAHDRSTNMPIILIHGNGLTGILNRIRQFKKGYEPLSVQEINGKETAFETAVLSLETRDLFASKRLVLLENFDDKIDLHKIPLDPDLTIIIRFSKSLTAANKLIKEAQALNAQIISITEADESNIFPFLDKLADKNSQVMEELDALLAEFGGQYMLTMIFYMLRRLVLSSHKLPSFVQQKIAKQKRNFDTEKIASLYKDALETDFKIKSGLTSEKMGITLLVNRILSI